METINKISDTQIEIISSNVSTTIDIPSTKTALEQDKQALADLEVRYAEQKANLLGLIERNTDILEKAESVGVTTDKEN